MGSFLAVANIGVSWICCRNFFLPLSPLHLKQGLCCLTALNMTKNVSRIILSVLFGDEDTLFAGFLGPTFSSATVGYIFEPWSIIAIFADVCPLAEPVLSHPRQYTPFATEADFGMKHARGVSAMYR